MPTNPSPQSPAGRFRDQAARFAWHELPKREKEVIRLACLDLYDVHLMGDTSVAELLFALGHAGILALLGPGEEGEVGPGPGVYLNGKVEDFNDNENN